jgi:hypothetical protein
MRRASGAPHPSTRVVSRLEHGPTHRRAHVSIPSAAIHHATPVSGWLGRTFSVADAVVSGQAASALAHCANQGFAQG